MGDHVTSDGRMALFVGGPLDMVTGTVDEELFADRETINCAGGRYVRRTDDPRFDWVEINEDA